MKFSSLEHFKGSIMSVNSITATFFGEFLTGKNVCTDLYAYIDRRHDTAVFEHINEILIKSTIYAV